VTKTATKSPQLKSLSDYIQERFEEFSRSQKDVARYIVDHLDEAAFLTAEELARRASTSSSTVVRFSQALGFEGYPELQQAAIEEYRTTIAAASLANGGPLFSFDHSELEGSLSADYSNLEETARKLTPEQVDASVDALLVGAAAHGLLWAGAGRGRALNLRPPAMKRIRAEIVASLIACPIYALPAALVLELWKRGGTAIYSDPDAWPLWWLPVSLIVYLLAHDAFYYWVHRALHHPRVFGWAHAEHHRSRDPSAFASFAFDPAEAAATAWFLPALALIVPIHWGVALTLLTLMSLTAALNHAGREVWPAAWLERAPLRWLITATHHDAHHKRFNGNYGLYFQFWDRWAGTEVSAAPSRPSPVIPPERPSAPLR